MDEGKLDSCRYSGRSDVIGDGRGEWLGGYWGRLSRTMAIVQGILLLLGRKRSVEVVEVGALRRFKDVGGWCCRFDNREMIGGQMKRE